MKQLLPIKALVFDIDGVVTDGTVLCSAGGPEQKRFSFRDVDAVFEARRRGLVLALVTGESTPWVDTIAGRLAVEHTVTGAKDKRQALEQLANQLQIPIGSICYVGDSDRDAPALEIVGLGLAPSDASSVAQCAADKVLTHPGGFGAVAEAVRLVLAKYLDEDSPKSASQKSGRPGDLDAIQAITRESLEVQQRTIDQLAPAIARAADAIADALARGGTIYAFGNGGSATDAEHLVAELVGRFESERPGLAALALTANSAVVTALSNDYGFESVFCRQLESLAKPGDVIVAISTSGTSKNVVAALRAARARGLMSIGLTGDRGRASFQLADIVLAVSSCSTARIQETHRLIIHLICRLVEDQHPAVKRTTQP